MWAGSQEGSLQFSHLQRVTESEEKTQSACLFFNPLGPSSTPTLTSCGRIRGWQGHTHPTPFFLIPGTPQWDPSSGGGGMHACTHTHTKRHLVIPHLYTHNMCISHYHSLLVLLFTHTHASWPPLWAPSSFAASSGSRCGSSRICEKILSVCFSLFTVIK